MTLAGEYDLQIDAKSPALDALNALLPAMQLPPLRRMTLATHLTNGAKHGDLPVIGTTQLHIGSADLSSLVQGLVLGATDVALPGVGGAATIEGQGSLRKVAFTLRGTAGVPPRLDDASSIPLDLAVATTTKDSLGVKGKLALKAGGFDGLDATIAMRSPALAKLGPMVARALPALTDMSWDGHLNVASSGTSWRWQGAKLNSHQGDAAGDLAIDVTPALGVSGKLRSTNLDLDAMLAAFGIDLGSSTGKRGATVISDADLPWAALRGTTIDVAATMASVHFQDEVWHNVDLAVELKGGRLEVPRLQMSLPAGPLSVSFGADASRTEVPASLSVHGPGIPLALLAHYAGLPGAASGTVRIEADLHATGRSPHDLVSTLDGSLTAAMTGGSVSNAALLALTGSALQTMNITVPAGGETKIACLGVAGAFKNGVGRFPTLAINTTYLELDGAGEIDLGKETVALKLHPLVQVSGSPVSVPVLVEGPFRAITGRLDASGLDKLGFLIDAWFGGDQPETCAKAGLAPRAK